jgi:hypothetical protein
LCLELKTEHGASHRLIPVDLGRYGRFTVESFQQAYAATAANREPESISRKRDQKSRQR